MRQDVRLGTVAGFPVAVSWSAIVIVLLLSWGLADGVLPLAAPGHATGTYWLAGVSGALPLMPRCRSTAWPSHGRTSA